MSITTVKTRCPAKVNLTFQVLGLLPDGYHEVKTSMQSVSLEDDLTFRFTDGDGKVSFSSVDSKFASNFPADESNLIVKAIRKFQQTVPQSSSKNIQVEIVKRIPIGAGLAGGSSNAAAALVALNHQFQNALSFQKLTSIGATLGADVPFCLMGGTAVGTHKGDVLTRIAGATTLHFLLVKPQQLYVATPWAFKQFDKLVLDTKGTDSTIDDTTEKCTAIIQNGTASDIAPHLVNDLEQAVFHHYSELNHIREELEKFGALRARLTGSGPTLYGLFSTRAEAEDAQGKLNEFQNIKQQNAPTSSKDSSAIYPLDSYVVESVEHGARVI